MLPAVPYLFSFTFTPQARKKSRSLSVNTATRNGFRLPLINPSALSCWYMHDREQKRIGSRALEHIWQYQYLHRSHTPWGCLMSEVLIKSLIFISPL